MASSTAVPSHLPPVKNVVVFRNGDPFRRFVVNQRQVATMEAFLNEVTQSIGAPLAVRNLYTPKQGHRVTDLQDLKPGAQYVAAGFERFKKLRPNVSAKWRKFIPVPCIISVFRNGDLLCPPFRFIIPRSMQQDLDQILSLVTEKVSLRTGAVRLCSLEGASISSAEELQTGRSYVAVGTERFKKLPYVELPEDRHSDSALLNSPESDGRRVKSTGDEASAPQSSQQLSRRKGADEASAFFARPVKVRKPGVFEGEERTNREEVRDAEEVQEDENTATELPVDQ
uniref:Doublecortin domain containing 2B n=1 Tax=Cyprinodon variegatus TaxID=28743 RepID=A0A3Q2E9X9_CYPVA